MNFLETPIFPEDISFNSEGGPRYNVTIISLPSGYEQRNENWVYPLHEYNVQYGVKTREDLEAVIAFFHSVGGPAVGFRYKDYFDCKSSGGSNSTISFQDQTIGVGNGVTTQFQLRKQYVKGALIRVRLIRKPVTGTVIIGVNGTQATSGWSVNTTTGIVTFDSEHIPVANQLITAGFEFHVPVRFSDDHLAVTIPDIDVASAQIKLEEIRV